MTPDNQVQFRIEVWDCMDGPYLCFGFAPEAVRVK
jgi:hypothetical protein